MPRRFPDFFIIGAQKSGTASLSALLTGRPDVFMCKPREPMFFCRDDEAIHPHTFLSNRELWREFRWDDSREELLDEYAGLFKAAQSDQVVGEGSTTYIVSERVPARIASVVPQARIIALLRNPIDRAYSAYFHHLKNFRVVHTFEEQLKFEPWDLLKAGSYRAHVERYLRCFPREQVLILPFEELVANTQVVLDRACDFLGLTRAPMREAERRSNQAQVPRFMTTQKAMNLALRWLRSDFEAGPIRILRKSDARALPIRAADKAVRALGKLNRWGGSRRYPPLSGETRLLLREHFTRENAGLSELTGIDFTKFWKDFSSL